MSEHPVNCIAWYVWCVVFAPFLTVMSYLTLTLFEISKTTYNLPIAVIVKTQNQTTEW